MRSAVEASRATEDQQPGGCPEWRLAVASALERGKERG
jgi:hypothetical protein